MMELSVVIPTYNRQDVLSRTIQAILAQVPDINATSEVVVVDDGSTDGTPERVHQVINSASIPVRYLRQPNHGPAAARNQGVRAASGELVLFLGDDMIPAPGLLAEHLHWHSDIASNERSAVLGRVTWLPEMEITPLMRWWEEARFRYARLLSAREEINFTYFYTCNISVKRRFLLDNGLFDEAFPYAAYEDTELGYRLTHQGLQIYFAPDALAYHAHPTNLDTICQVMETTGRSSKLFQARTGIIGLPRLWQWIGAGPWNQPWLIRPLMRLVNRVQTQSLPPVLYIPILMYHYHRGRAFGLPSSRIGET